MFLCQVWPTRLRVLQFAYLEFIEMKLKDQVKFDQPG